MARKASAEKKAEKPVESVKAPKGISETVNKKKTVKKEISKLVKTEVAPPKPGCTLYIGRLPHGFNEEELHGYFSQFGQVSRLRVSRNKKTGAPKHFAFLEFQHGEVAKIVAETMNNYLLFGHLVQCRVMRQSELHADLFKGAGRKFTKIPWAKIAAKKFNSRREGQTEEEAAKEAAEAKKRIEACKERCKAAGIDYDFGSVVTKRVEA